MGDVLKRIVFVVFGVFTNGNYNLSRKEPTSFLKNCLSSPPEMKSPTSPRRTYLWK